MPLRTIKVCPSLVENIFAGTHPIGPARLAEHDRVEDLRVIDCRWVYDGVGEIPMIQLLVESPTFEPWLREGEIRSRWDAPVWNPTFERVAP